MSMSELDIIKILSERTDERRFPWQLARSFVYGWESDFWTMTKDGETREYEIKVSRADYLIDCKKKKHSDVNQGANYFYYVAPEGLIKPDEVCKGYGLIEVSTSGFPQLNLTKKPMRLNQNVFTDWKILANKMYWKFRALWREKYISNEISHQEYWAGFSIELEP